MLKQDFSSHICAWQLEGKALLLANTVSFTLQRLAIFRGHMLSAYKILHAEHAVRHFQCRQRPCKLQMTKQPPAP